MVLLFRAMEIQDMGKLSTQLRWKKVGHGCIQNLPVINGVVSDGSMHDSTTAEYFPSKGKLPDGRRYFVYCFLIYYDGLSTL